MANNSNTSSVPVASLTVLSSSETASSAPVPASVIASVSTTAVAAAAETKPVVGSGDGGNDADGGDADGDGGDGDGDGGDADGDGDDDDGEASAAQLQHNGQGLVSEQGTTTVTNKKRKLPS